MDVFWLIPVMIVGIALLWGFWMYMRRQPESPSKPHVLVDKPPTPEDPAEKQRDWTGRPCGSYLDWLFGRSKK